MFERDRAALEAAAERAIALNPLHTRTLAVVGVQLAFSGETDRGALLARDGPEPALSGVVPDRPVPARLRAT
jgi:hypothetical protein